MRLLPPLRTVRDSFPSHRSSLSRARDLTRFLNELPSQYASAAVARTVPRFANQWHPNSGPLRTHQSGATLPLSFAYPHDGGSTHSLAMKDPSDVGSLSCRVTFKPVSATLHRGIRFFRHPKPAPPWANLTARRPGNAGSGTGFPRSAREVQWVRCLLSTGKRVDHENAGYKHSTRLQYLLVKRDNHLRLSQFTVFITDSDIFTLPSI